MQTKTIFEDFKNLINGENEECEVDCINLCYRRGENIINLLTDATELDVNDERLIVNGDAGSSIFQIADKTIVRKINEFEKEFVFSNNLEELSLSFIYI